MVAPEMTTAMRDDPLVSVIIIFLNAESYLRQAIESVLSQTYEHWELLLVDDGSTDGSSGLAHWFATQNPTQIHYIDHPGHENLGMSAARNLGLRYARGKFVAFLDADDIWLPQMLERQVALLRTTPEAGMVYGNTMYWHSWTGRPEDLSRDYMPRLGVEPGRLYKPPDLLSLLLGEKAAVPCINSLLVYRGIVERVGGFEESFQGLYEDQVFYAKICLAAPILVTDECLAWYRQHLDSECSQRDLKQKHREARQRYLTWLVAYLLDQGITDRRLWRSLRITQWKTRYPPFAHLHRIIQRLLRSVRSDPRRVIRIGH